MYLSVEKLTVVQLYIDPTNNYFIDYIAIDYTEKKDYH